MNKSAVFRLKLSFGKENFNLNTALFFMIYLLFFNEHFCYVYGRRLYTCINTRKFKGLDSREITSLPEIKEVIYIARHLNQRRK